MFRKSVSIVLVLLIVALAVLPFTVSAKSNSDFEYSLNGGKAEITKYIGTASAVVVPDKLDGCEVESIVYPAFSFNNDIESIALPESLKRIGSEAFSSCKKLSSITLPKSLEKLGIDCFQECVSLKTINVEEGNEIFRSIDGNLYNTDETKLIQYAVGKTDEAFEIPEIVKTICESAFSSCKSLKTVSIPDSVTAIEDSAFLYCSALSNVKVPSTVEDIGFGIFMNCENLTDVTLPDRLESIGMYAFDGCSKLETVKLPENLTIIKDCTFYDCGSLKNIVIPDTVTSIGQEAFYFCKNLSDVELPEGLSSLSEYAFGYCQKLESVTLGSNLKTVGEGAFRWCKSLKNVTVKGASTKISELAFDAAAKSLAISGHIGSYAESYAKNERIGFINLDSPVSIKSLKMNKLKSKTYTGKAVSQSVVIKNNRHTLVEGIDFTVTCRNNKSVGTATVIVKGKGDYTGTITGAFKITKAANPLTVKTAVTRVKCSDLQRRNVTVKPLTVRKNQGKLSFKKISGNSRIVLNTSTGKFTVKKGLKKGTYALKVRVSAKGNNNYKGVSKNVTVKIKVN